MSVLAGQFHSTRPSSFAMLDVARVVEMEPGAAIDIQQLQYQSHCQYEHNLQAHRAKPTRNSYFRTGGARH